MPTAPRSRVAVVSAIGLVALLISGCTSGETAAPATPTPTPTVVLSLETGAPAVSGTGPTQEFPGVGFPLPDDARSVTIDVECSGGGAFSVELGDSMLLGQATLDGPCDGTTATMSWPITDQTGPTLTVVVDENAKWVASPRFSADEFVSDATIAAECTAFAEVYSALMNADQGYTLYQAIDAAEWTARVDAAAADLAALAESSDTAMADAFGQLLSVVRSPDRVVGAIGAGSGEITQFQPISEICATNQSPLMLTGEFGG